MSSKAIHEAQFVDLTDDELKRAIAHFHERIVNLSNAKKGDQKLAELKAEAKDWEDANYNDEIKKSRIRLKAARSQATQRGLRFDLPNKVTI